MSAPKLPLTIQKRADNAYRIREAAARTNRDAPHPQHDNNGDEADYLVAGQPTYAGNFSKGMAHDDKGQVNRDHYRTLLTALESGQSEAFEQIHLSVNPTGAGRHLTNPQAGLAYDLEGPDAWALAQPPAPKLNSDRAAAEMAELYWMSLTRDVNFADFEAHYADTGSLVRKACDSLTDEFLVLDPLRDAAHGSRVSGKTLFRGNSWLTGVGPYLSQFLLRGNRDINVGNAEKDGQIRYGTLYISQMQQTAVGARIRTPADASAGLGRGGDFTHDYMKDAAAWLAVQNGTPGGPLQIDTERRFISTPRDLAHYVHFDALYEAYLNAAFLLMSMDAEMQVPKNAPLAPLLPYNHSGNQDGFGTFGGPHILSLVTEAATRALKAVWFQKWFVHRRLRPEEYGGRVHFARTGQADSPIHPSLLGSPVLTEISERTGGAFFLPQAFPEGSPMHPAYGAGHATVAGACVTILKAFFDGNTPIPNPLVPSVDGKTLVPYTGADRDQLTVVGELNKLAENVAIGRNMAGVHWRSDATESLKLGEKIGLGILRDQRPTYNESFRQFIISFDGKQIEI